jgi:voltage-gated sodium channel
MGIVRPVMEVFPLAWIFFLLFILSSTFTLLNLFIAVIVNAIQQEGTDEAPAIEASEAALLREEIKALRDQLHSLRLPERTT